jgi:sulfate adenylyltransferase
VDKTITSQKLLKFRHVNDHLISPHGGDLINLLVRDEELPERKRESSDLVSWDLSERQLFDLELLINGGFSPCTGFMTSADYQSVCSHMRLACGTIWPIPIILDVPEGLVRKIHGEKKLALRDPEGALMAVMNISDVWKPNKLLEVERVYCTTNKEHPGVSYILDATHDWYVGGRIEAVKLPHHYDFPFFRSTPREQRAAFSRLGWRKIVAFQTRNPMHRAHYELTLRAVKENEANLLIHPVVGSTKPGDVDHYTRVRCYQKLLCYYPENMALLSLLPLAMRMAGPREAILHAIIRKNYGCSHFIVGRDHAGPGNDSKGNPFYEPYAAQELIKEYGEELAVKMVPFKNMVYIEDEKCYVQEDEVTPQNKILDVSGTDLRMRLSRGEYIPQWFTFPEIADELRKSYPPRHKQGFTVFFTGLPGSGKSTIAKAFMAKMLEMGGRSVTLLDGDIVRKHLSSELGFSKEHRETNIRRIGFVASEITKNGGITICAPIAPYDTVRKEVRDTISPLGGFYLVYVSTPIHVCESRDCKGLYKKARAGLVKEFTGISDPYEAPDDADITVDTTDTAPEDAVQRIVAHLRKDGYIVDG